MIIGLSGNSYRGKISDLTNAFNKIDMKETSVGMNYFRRVNEKKDEEVER